MAREWACEVLWYLAPVFWACSSFYLRKADVFERYHMVQIKLARIDKSSSTPVGAHGSIISGHYQRAGRGRHGGGRFGWVYCKARSIIVKEECSIPIKPHDVSQSWTCGRTYLRLRFYVRSAARSRASDRKTCASCPHLLTKALKLYDTAGMPACEQERFCWQKQESKEGAWSLSYVLTALTVEQKGSLFSLCLFLCVRFVYFSCILQIKRACFIGWVRRILALGTHVSCMRYESASFGNHSFLSIRLFFSSILQVQILLGDE